jgi:uncharacterized protein YjbI with pentapeptide repeats
MELLLMRKLVTISLLISAIAMPAFAQNQAQIDAVFAGRKSCAGCNLFQAPFVNLELSGRNFAGSRLRQSDLSLATADRTNFGGADLSIAVLYGVRATGANFNRANLERAILVGGYFNGSNFSRANLNGANLSGAELSNARGLTQNQLNNACGDEATILPRGLVIRRCN